MQAHISSTEFSAHSMIPREGMVGGAKSGRVGQSPCQPTEGLKRFVLHCSSCMGCFLSTQIGILIQKKKTQIGILIKKLRLASCKYWWDTFFLVVNAQIPALSRCSSEFRCAVSSALTLHCCLLSSLTIHARVAFKKNKKKCRIAHWVQETKQTDAGARSLRWAHPPLKCQCSGPTRIHTARAGIGPSMSRAFDSLKKS